MAVRRPADGWMCENCESAYFAKDNVCPWCVREMNLVERIPEENEVAREKVRQLARRLRAITERDGWTCWLCGKEVDPLDLGEHHASADHVQPVAMRGSNALLNLRLAHQSCNGYRSGTKRPPFAPFDKSPLADAERRIKHLEYIRSGLSRKE